MRNIKLTLEYDGTDFSGWQWQPRLRTVQGTLQQALAEILETSPTVLAAGRTDAGVHALGQVVNFKTESTLGAETFKNALNDHLPRDVVVLESTEVAESFHARYDAVRRTYRYVISRRHRAVGRQYAWYCKFPLDVGRMREAAAPLMGEHVFAAFSKASEDEPHFRCCVEDIRWEETEDEVVFTISANRFLHNMVRILVGTLVEVGRGRLRPEEVEEILASEDRSRAGFTVPAHGLFLQQVDYES